MSTSPQTIPGDPRLELYTAHDFIRPGEQPLYDELNDSLYTNLAPQGILECTLVDEIRRATWRLRRCGIVEENLAAADSPEDPMQHESQNKIQLVVDRARSRPIVFSTNAQPNSANSRPSAITATKAYPRETISPTSESAICDPSTLPLTAISPP